MLGGTGSDVGKSVLAAGLCRIFRQDGYSPAPFKAQNMALNSYATPEGLEIGRAQAVQAEAAGIECCADMNPVLLKPSGERTSQVVLLGKPVGNRDAYEYFRREGRDELREAAHAAFDRLSKRYNPIVMEGAGSIAELNLRDTDIVNLPMARYADARVILVADIDRGGVFASAYGSIMLQRSEDRHLIRGIIVNKFRGDMRLFEEGRRILEQTCGVPVVGVVPMFSDLSIEEEDSVALRQKRRNADAGKINMGVVMTRHISNFTDFDAVERDSRFNLFYTDNPAELEMADVVVLPGSKNTIGDLAELRRRRLDISVLKAARAGKMVIGICGGYQMMGMQVADPMGVEGSLPETNGLALLPVRTVIGGEKVTRPVTFRFLAGDEECNGYEIHMGSTVIEGDAHPLCHLSDGTDDGCRVSPRCFGSYLHGLLDNTSVRDYIVSVVGKGIASDEPAFDYAAFKETQYNLLASRLREHLDMELIYKIMSND